MQKKIIFPIFVLSIIILLFLSPLLYYFFDISFYTSHSVPIPGVSQEQSLFYVQNVYSFLKNNQQLSDVFTPNEKFHLQDVRVLFHIIVVCEIVALFLFSVFFVFFLFQKKISSLLLGFLWASSITLFLFLLLLVIIIIDFDMIFLVFHRFFFPQGNWSFDGSSIMIQLFSFLFFKAIVIRIFLTSLGFSLALFLVALHGIKKNKVAKFSPFGIIN